MGKALKTAGAIIGGAVLMATGVGALAGLQVTAMGIAGIGTMSVANLQLMSAGLMAAGSMLDKPKSTASGSPSDWTSNPDQGIPFLFGRMGVAGKIVHRDEYGQDNRLQGIVTIYSGAGPVKSFQGFTADELPVSFVSNGGTAVGKYNRQMWRSWRMGAQPDTALSLPTGLDGGAVMPMWGPLYKLSGKACDLLTLQQDSKFSVYPSGEPKPMQVLEGVYGYDPRYDDSYPGGAGPCRYGVRSTYRYIDNAIIAALNWALGMVENGQVVGGIGASLQGVDLPAFVEAANIADANAWTVAAWPDTSEDASVVLDELLEAGGAKRSRVAGKISCVSRGAPRPSIVTITRRDTAGAIELDTGASRFNRLNTITPVIMSEAHKWEHAPMNPVSFAPLVAEDGGKRSDQIKYRFVPKVKQGAELAAYDILDAREPFAGTIPLLPHLRRLKPGDCFDIDEPGFMLDGVKMLVLGRSYDPKAGEVRIAFRSETDSKHPLALGKTTTMPDYPGLTAPDPTEVSPPQPGDWTIIPRPPAPGGGQLPVIDLSGIVSNATADAMLINWREVAGGEDPDAQPPFMDEAGDLLPGWVDAGVWPPTTRTLSIQGPQPGAQIWIAVRYKRGNNVSAPELAGPITVGDLIAGGLAPDAAEKVVQEVLGKVGEAQEDTETARRQAELTLETILNEQQSLEAEAAERLAADTGVLNESKSFTDGKIAQAMNTVYTKAETDAGLASTLQDARSYTDDFKSEASLTFSTKAERASGDAIAVLQAKAYTDDFKSEASLTYTTKAAFQSGLATTLNDSHSFTNGQISMAMSTVYTKAEVDSGRATTIQEAKSYSDDKMTEASLLFSTKAERENGDAEVLISMTSYVDAYKAEAEAEFAAKSSLNGISATAALALSTAVGADGKVNAKFGLVTNVDGLITGISSENDGVRGSVDILSTVFNLYSTGSGVQTSYIAGVWYILDPGENTRTLYGKAFGGAQKLVWWTGSNSVPLGGETKANAYVYISMNTVGGPRFGGSDVGSTADGGRRLIAFSGKATNGTNYSTLGSASVQSSPGSIVQATVSTTFYGVSPSGAGGLDGSLQLWEQDASGRSNIGPSVIFTAVDAEFIAKSMIGVGTKSGAVTYGVDWRASTGSVNAINAQGQIDLMVMRGS